MTIQFSRTVNFNGFFVDLFLDDGPGKEFIVFHGEQWFFDDKALMLDLEGRPVAGAWRFPFYLVDKRNNFEWRLDVSLDARKTDGLFWNTAIHYIDLDEPNAPCFSETRRYEDQEKYDPDARFNLTIEDFAPPLEHYNNSSRNHPLFTDPTI